MVGSVGRRAELERLDHRFPAMRGLAAAIRRALSNPSLCGAPAELPRGRGVGGGLTPPPGTLNASPTSAPPHSSTPIPVGAGSSLVSTPTMLGSGIGNAAPPTRPARWVLSLFALLVLGGGVLVFGVLGGGQVFSHAATARQPIAATAPAIADAAMPASHAGAANDPSTDSVVGQLGTALPGILVGFFAASRRRGRRWLFRPRL